MGGADPATGEFLRDLRTRPAEVVDVQSELATEDVALKRQHRELRDLIQKKVFRLLWAQLIALVVLLVLQGFRLWGFQLNEWAFGVLVNGALVQTFFIVRFIVAHLFPQNSVHSHGPSG